MVSLRKHAELVTNNYAVMRRWLQTSGDDYKPAEYWDIFYETLRNIQMVSMRS